MHVTEDGLSLLSAYGRLEAITDLTFSLSQSTKSSCHLSFPLHIALANEIDMAPSLQDSTQLWCFSNKSFASLTLLARYGDPPQSGWLASII